MSAPDPYSTAALRAATLSAWTTAPRRLREDAAHEDDAARGAYADRVVVELLQNAADAAARARTSGSVLVELAVGDDQAVLRVSNTGAPLTPDGVAALASMRTSDKYLGDEVGRFGVGFAAVRAVADVVTVASCDGAVRFDVAEARAQIGTAGLLEELDGRGLAVPALRLPYEDPTTPEQGWTTTVVLRLRGPAEIEQVTRQVDELDEVLLLALPRLAVVTVVTPSGRRQLTADADAWWIATAHGAAELTGREQDSAGAWWVTWAVPREARASGSVPGVIHAPTPTEAPCTLPAVLLGSFPVEPSRRRIVAGEVAADLARRAGAVYAELVARVARAGGSPLPFAPSGLPADELDATIRASAADALARTPLLAPATALAGARAPVPAGSGGGPGAVGHPAEDLVAPRDAVALAGAPGSDPALLAALSRVQPGLVALRSGEVDAARALGVTVRDLAAVLEELVPGHDDAGWWRELLDAVSEHVPQSAVREALATMPVPLVGGGTAHGPRGLVVLDDDAAAEVLAATATFAPFGMRVVHPAAAHPLLERLGAGRASAATLLGHDAVHAALAALDAEPDGDPALAEVRDAVLALVAGALAEGLDASRVPPGLGDLPLPAEDGGHEPARSLVLPGTPAEQLFAAADRVSDAALERWGAEVLGAVGVRSGLRAAVVPDVLASDALIDGDEGDDARVEGWAEYLGDVADHLGVEAFLGDVTVIEDLDDVDDDAWGAALTAIAGSPELRAALVHHVRGASGARAPSYASWWLRDRLGSPFAAPGTHVPFLPDAPASDVGAALQELDDEVLRALGAVRALDELDAAGWDGCFDALPDAGAQVELSEALALWRALARTAATGARLPVPPDRLVVLDGDAAVVADAAWAVVADGMTGQLGPHVPAPANAVDAVAAFLDVETAQPATPTADGPSEELPPVLREVVRALLPDAPASWVRAERLSVAGRDVRWWVADGALFARDEYALVRAVAYTGGVEGWHVRLARAVADGDARGALVDLARALPPPRSA